MRDYRAYSYDKRHSDQAKVYLKNIESKKGETDPKLIKLSKEYAIDVFGSSVYAPWLYVYSAVAGCFKEGWIPDNYYGRIVVPAIKGDYGKISDYKSLTNKIFRSDLFPDLVYSANGLFLSKNYEVLPGREVKKIVFENSNMAVYKSDNSLNGKGVYIFDELNFDVKKIKNLGNGVIQGYINQHDFFKEFMPSSVATLRLTTFIDDLGNSTLRACYLQIGRHRETHVQTKSEIVIPINLKTGELYEQGYTSDMLILDRHPDTKVLFAKKQIPDFYKCITTALELHKLIPFARCIGWDMTIDKNNNVKLMEWNGSHNGIKYSEPTQGPCFSNLGWENIWKN